MCVAGAVTSAVLLPVRALTPGGPRLARTLRSPAVTTGASERAMALTAPTSQEVPSAPAPPAGPQPQPADAPAETTAVAGTSIGPPELIGRSTGRLASAVTSTEAIATP